MSPIINQQDLSKILNRSKVTIWRYVKSGALPQPISINGRCLGWKAETIESWLNQQSHNI